LNNDVQKYLYFFFYERYKPLLISLKISVFNSFKRNHKKAIRTFDRVEYVNISALRLLFLQVIGKVSMFD